MPNMRFFATAAKGTESLVAQELAAIGAQKVRSTPGGVHFEGGLGNALPGEPLAPHRESGADADSGILLPDAGSPLRKCA